MTEAEHYRRKAELCLKKARVVESEADREELRATAEAWLVLAQMYEPPYRVEQEPSRANAR